MTNTHDPLDDDNQPKPPTIVYKYVIGGRADVLEGARIRFTPPLNTNDIFEVRQTFDLLAGPKMTVLFDEQAAQVDVDQAFHEALAELGLGDATPDQIQALLAVMGGDQFAEDLRSTVRGVARDVVFPMMNSQKSVDDLLEKLGSDLICLSLSDTPYSAPLWAHYADNSQGFVIAFKTDSAFFRSGGAGERNGLFRVAYQDERMNEVLDDPFAALISKTSDWAYEHEWRLYVKREAADHVIGSPPHEIHLVSFPRGAVDRVILGLRADEALAARLAAILEADYSGVPLMRLRADRSTAALIEVAAERS